MYYEFTITYQYKGFDRPCKFTTYADDMDEALEQFYNEPQGRLNELYEILEIKKHEVAYVDETDELEQDNLVQEETLEKVYKVLDNLINANQHEVDRYDNYIGELIDNGEYNTRHDDLVYYREERALFSQRKNALELAKSIIQEEF